MSALSKFHRCQEIQRIRGDLERDSFPRLQMLLLVTLTGTSGFVASYILLRAGFVEMWLRYLVSFGFAYLVFLVLLWLWLRTRVEDYADLPDLSGFPSSRSAKPETIYSGKGSDLGSASANESFDAASNHISASGDPGNLIDDALGVAAEAEDFAIPLMVLVVTAAIVCSSLFIIYSAPILFAELLVDGVLSASLYRRLRGLETRHWLETALRRTALPFAFTAVIVSISGWGMALYAPGAHSIGDVISHAKQGS